MPNTKSVPNPSTTKTKQPRHGNRTSQTDHRKANPAAPSKPSRSTKAVERKPTRSSDGGDVVATPTRPYTSTDSMEMIDYKPHSNKYAATSDSSPALMTLPQGIRDIFRSHGLNSFEVKKIERLIQDIRGKAQDETVQQKLARTADDDKVFDLQTDLRERDPEIRELERYISKLEAEIRRLEAEIQKGSDYFESIKQ